MSRIVTEILRSHDERLLKVKAFIDYRGTWDRCSVELKSDSGILTIISTSAGSILENKVFMSQAGFIQIFAEFVDDPNLHCLISYFREKELIHFETLPITLSVRTGLIQDDIVNLKEISSVAGDYSEKLDHVNKTHALYKMPWRAHVFVDTEIIVRFLKKGTHKTYMSFGEITPELLASDFFFSVDQKTSEVIIPRELIWSKYDSYSLNALLGCCLIVTTDFHSLPNRYHKIKISNSIDVSDLPKRGEERKLSEFIGPLGQPLEAGWQINKASNLPVYVEKS